MGGINVFSFHCLLFDQFVVVLASAEVVWSFSFFFFFVQRGSQEIPKTRILGELQVTDSKVSLIHCTFYFSLMFHFLCFSRLNSFFSFPL